MPLYNSLLIALNSSYYYPFILFSYLPSLAHYNFQGYHATSTLYLVQHSQLILTWKLYISSQFLLLLGEYGLNYLELIK